jgi:DNA-binding LacI/PurR family transcriptional regulator
MPPKSTKDSAAATSGKADTRVRIQDVAQAAQVSNSSVSNYLNDRFHRLSPETRGKIAEAIASLGYHPNQAARQLKTGKRSVLAVTAPSIINPFNGGLVLAIEQAAFEAGYGVYLCNTMRDPRLEKRFLDSLNGSGVAHLISVAPHLTRRGPYSAGRDDLSIVAVDASRADMGLAHVNTINMDHEAALQLAVDHLYGQGHRRFAYVTDPIITFSRVMRLAGFHKSLARHGLVDQAVITAERNEDIADINMVDVGREAASQLVALTPRPTAVIAFNDMIALGLLTGLRAAGLAVPRDLSLIGIDDIWAGQVSSPALTSVRQPIEAMAAAAVERIVRSDKSHAGAGSDTVFQPTLIVRETTDAPPGARTKGKEKRLTES